MKLPFKRIQYASSIDPESQTEGILSLLFMFRDYLTIELALKDTAEVSDASLFDKWQPIADEMLPNFDFTPIACQSQIIAIEKIAKIFQDKSHPLTIDFVKFHKYFNNLMMSIPFLAS